MGKLISEISVFGGSKIQPIRIFKFYCDHLLWGADFSIQIGYGTIDEEKNDFVMNISTMGRYGRVIWPM